MEQVLVFDGDFEILRSWFFDGADGGKGENCAIVDLTEGTGAGKWADQPCTSVNYYICERGFNK